MTLFKDLLPQERIVKIESRNKNEALRELVHLLSNETEEVLDEEGLFDAILDREEILSTGIGFGLAIPHAKISSVKNFALALGFSESGIDFGSLDDKPVHIMVMIIGPDHQQQDYLKLLARITKFLKAEKRNILSAESISQIHKLTEIY